ncbi:hypothetical protein [Pseudobacteriovorax antillogorgiicola]|uniref:Uncharacterized protein n=1 Tax=Pseudobacteriovorax antillogorgiicola TaxID=1513793 RepID=A0A1Y6BXD2_9BACT|nr:hypothetical protein [Pseudobacteriovorax antillogorgiicola]TCS50335.1 hypothetical protein EDD56_113153 [Pseudobacteriovorax antillogorgiicola]SMF34582.1 hypothetical protein SAMN06296036_110152 [Pseudobacteriovorax antillogorgiicola]
METMGEVTSSWKTAKNLDEAKNLVDMGVLLSWKDTRPLKKVLDNDGMQELVRYIAVRLAERVESRLPEEILIESLLVLLANSQEEVVLNAFLEELVQQPNPMEACETLVELAITAEISDSEHYEDIFSIAVALICELGNLIQSIQQEYADDETLNTNKVLDHISTYLLSVSNSNNNCIRLSLVHYFGSLEKGKSHKPGFNRIMGRFGHTVLEHLFTLLFNKKTEAVALQFLLENTPYILEADNHCQKILHETWKYYMLKKPERFALFIQTLTGHLVSQPQNEQVLARRVFLQHLGVLLKIVSEVNHKDLGREIMCAIGAFAEDPFRNELIKILSNDKGIRENFRNLVGKLLDAQNAEQVIDEADGFRSSKRGRKPSFAKADKTKPIYQATFLGHQTVARAS